MKKFFCKGLIILLLLFMVSVKALCSGIKFNNSFISDDAKIFDQTYTNVLNDMLKNLQKDTSVDFAIVTLNEFEKNQTFNDIENQILKKYNLGGKNTDKWVILIATRNPIKIYINTGKTLTKTVPKTMIRALKMEYFVTTKIGNIGFGEVTQNTQQATNYLLQTGLYAVIVPVVEAVADEYGAQVYYKRDSNDIVGIFMDGEVAHLPHTNPIIKFIRKYNLYPALIVLTIGIAPYYFRYIFRRMTGRSRRRKSFRQRFLDISDSIVKKM